MCVPRADRQQLVLYLCVHCRGREKRLKQPLLATALGWSTRYLQRVLSEEAQVNGRIDSSSGQYAGVWWNVDVEDYRLADSNLAGRIDPLARRRRAIRQACPGLGQEQLLEVA